MLISKIKINWKEINRFEKYKTIFQKKLISLTISFIAWHFSASIDTSSRPHLFFTKALYKVKASGQYLSFDIFW